MRITKDEARILANALENAKYDLDAFPYLTSEAFRKLTQFENKLRQFGKDKRRQGRISQNDWSDLMKRFTNSNK